MSKKSIDLSNFGNLLGGKNSPNSQGFNLGNLLNDEGTMNILTDLVSKISPHLLNGEIVSQMLNSNPNLTNEYLTEQINNFKKSHPESNKIIDKYLKSYQEKDSNKNIYNIHKFIKSDDWTKALDDPLVEPYLKEFMNKSEVKEKIREAIAKSKSRKRAL